MSLTGICMRVNRSRKRYRTAVMSVLRITLLDLIERLILTFANARTSQRPQSSGSCSPQVLEGLEMNGRISRGERLQIMLNREELAALDDWRFRKRMPSRASAIREILRRGLAAEGFDLADSDTQSKEFGVIEDSVD